MKHLADISDLSVAEIDSLIATAEDISAHPEKYEDAMQHKTLATLFFEPSTRTRLSFETAMLSLGGSVAGFSDADTSSASKGETLADTIEVVSGYVDIIAMRHYAEGAPYVAMAHSEVPIINAGDGGHFHPTQTLADLLTVKREKGETGSPEDRFLRRSEIRQDRPLPDCRNGALRGDRIGSDLAARVGAPRFRYGRDRQSEGDSLHGLRLSGGCDQGLGRAVHDPRSEGTFFGSCGIYERRKGSATFWTPEKAESAKSRTHVDSASASARERDYAWRWTSDPRAALFPPDAKRQADAHGADFKADERAESAGRRPQARRCGHGDICLSQSALRNPHGAVSAGALLP